MQVSTAESKKKLTPKRIVGSLTTVILGAVFLFVFICLAVIIFQVSSGNQPNLFGYRFYVVVTDSMTPELQVGDVLISKITGLDADSAADIAVGDIITYTAEYGDQRGRSITHRVIESAHYDSDYDRMVITTRGDKQGSATDLPVPIENVNAVMVKNSGILTALYAFFTSFTGIICLLAIPFGFIIVTLVIRLVNIIRNPVDEDAAAPPDIAARKKEIAEKAVADFIESQRNPFPSQSGTPPHSSPDDHSHPDSPSNTD